MTTDSTGMTADMANDAIAPKTKNEKQDRARLIVRSTALLIVLFAVAKMISLGQTVIIANVFGVSREWDAYVTANRIPEIIVVLISGGALGHAFIPIFSSLLAREQADRAWQLASHIINTIFAVALVISTLVFITTPWWVSNVIAPGFDAATTEQTVVMMRILLLGTIIFAISGIFSAILHSYNHFLLPAIAPIMYDVGILFGVVVLLPRFGIAGVAWGTVLGAGMHLLIQVPGLIRRRGRWFTGLGLRDPQLRRVIRLMLPRIAGLGVFQFNMLVMNNIGSRLGVGSVSALDWGWRLMQIPQTLIGTAMGIVIFPTLAELSEVGDQDGKRNAMSAALRFILIASIPSAIGLVVVGQPLVSLLERGAFDASASALVYATLRAFTLGLIVHSALEVVARSFYADKDTLTPLWAALVGATVNVVLSVVLSDVATVQASTAFNSIAGTLPQLGLVARTGNVAGLALANSLGVMCEVLVLLVILRRRWSGVEEAELGSTVLKALTASLVMAVAVLGIEMAWTALGLGSRGLTFQISQIAVQGIVGVIVFLVTALLLRMHEITDLLRLIFNRRPLQLA